MSDFPVVCALCCTRNRRQWLPLAIRYWEAQDYPADKLRLLILADGESISDLVPLDRRIELFSYPTDKFSVGRKRNFSCAIAERYFPSASVMAVWDDDDYSAPWRITDQVTRLLSTGKSVTGYSSMAFTDGRDWWMYDGLATPHVVMGTSLCFKLSWWQDHRFRDWQVGQDEEFGYDAAAQQQLVSAPAGGAMYATVHPGNTSKRQLGQPPFRKLPEMPDYFPPWAAPMEFDRLLGPQPSVAV